MTYPVITVLILLEPAVRVVVAMVSVQMETAVRNMDFAETPVTTVHFHWGLVAMDIVEMVFAQMAIVVHHLVGAARPAITVLFQIDGSRGNGICADGYCCSSLGFCGTTADHCFLLPRTCGEGSPGNNICADGYCCSSTGWCTTNIEYCTDV